MDNKFRKIRLQSGLTTDEAISQLGISISTLYKIEQGYRNPSTKLILKMSKVYGCTVESIINALNITISDKKMVI